MKYSFGLKNEYHYLLDKSLECQELTVGRLREFLADIPDMTVLVPPPRFATKVAIEWDGDELFLSIT